MYRLLTVEQLREVERRVIEEQGVSQNELMRRAGIALASVVLTELENMDRHPHPNGEFPIGKIVICVGPGNNGGDGWSCAAELQRRGFRATVLSLVDINDLTGAASEAAFEAVGVGVHWELVREEATTEEILAAMEGADICVDALLGVGARLPLSERIARVCDAINSSGALVIAADVPTGINSDTGEVDEHAVAAVTTVTMLSAKIGATLTPAFGNVGGVVVEPLGIDESVFLDFLGTPELYGTSELGREVPMPALEANKYSRGRVLVVAGSRQYPGAAVLCVKGAMKSGAGYVTLACPESLVTLMQTHLIAAPVVGLAETREGTLSDRALGMLLDLASMADAVVIGPGLDRSPKTAQLVRSFVGALDDTPVVIDADALNAFVDHTEELTRSTGNLILTPHAGELSRLVGEASSAIKADPLTYGRKLAGDKRTVVLKGPVTIITTSYVQSVDVFAPPALATAGTGDILAGMLAALTAQGLKPYRAACVAVRLHGLAGLAARNDLTSLCVTSEDILNYIPRASIALQQIGRDGD